MHLDDVCKALETASPDRLFTVRGRVVDVHRVNRSCYFTLSAGRAELPCAMLRRQAAQADFWVSAGQEIEVVGHAEHFRDRWQLFVLEARLLRVFADLGEVGAALESAPSDRLFVTPGRVNEVHRVRRSCYFTLADGSARLHCALLRRNAMRLDFWVTAGQEIEVTGYAERFRGRYQLYAVEAQLLRGEAGWPRRYRHRPARRVVAWFDALLDLFFPTKPGFSSAAK